MRTRDRRKTSKEGTESHIPCNAFILTRPTAVLSALVLRVAQLASCYIFRPSVYWISAPASLFIDSASTQRLSFLTLERLVDDLNRGKLPKPLIQLMRSKSVETLDALVKRSNFKLMHLIETHDRAQNSTAWLRIEPVDVEPSIATHFH